MNTRLDALGARITVGIAAGDDVLTDLGIQLGRALFMEINDRRNVAGDIFCEQLSNLHRVLTRRCGSSAETAGRTGAAIINKRKVMDKSAGDSRGRIPARP